MQMAHEDHPSSPADHGIEITDKPTVAEPLESGERRITATDKKRIVSVLFGRLINTHKSIMKALVLLHIAVLLSLIHI